MSYGALIRQLRGRIVGLERWKADAMRRARESSEPKQRQFFVTEARVHNRAIVWRQVKIAEYSQLTRRGKRAQALRNAAAGVQHKLPLEG